MQLIISAFPGCGKSTLTKNAKEHGLVHCHVYKDEHGEVCVDVPVREPGEVCIYDSDSSNFDKAGFPDNYISHIKEILQRHPNVVIMVSSHEAVRVALREHEISYKLVYPKRDLRDEFIQRYIERGSPEPFVNMMKEKWDDFIDSCEKDPTYDGLIIQLNSGEGIESVFSPLIKSIVEQQKKDDGVVMKLDNFTTTELKDFHLKVKTDIEVIQTSIIDNKDQYSGCESLSDEGHRLTRVAEYIKETYNEEVSPDITGMESFVEKLKAGFKQVTEALKSKPNKQRLTVIKTAAYQATSAAKVYESTKWLDEQTFINIGNVKFQVPSIFKDVKSLDDAKKIIDGIFKHCETDFNTNMKDMEKRLSTGLTLFNKYKSKEWDEKYLQEVEKALPIKPEIKKLDKQVYLDLVGTGYVPASIPVLTKDMVKEVSELMVKLGGFAFKMEATWEIFATDTMDTSDFWDSSFWDNVPDETLSKIWDTVEWHRINDTVFSPLESGISKVLFELVKFLENWILYSVK